MTKLVIRYVTQGTFLTALIAVLSTTPAFAGVGGGVPAGLLRLDPPSSQPSLYPGRAFQRSTTQPVAPRSRIGGHWQP